MMQFVTPADCHRTEMRCFSRPRPAAGRKRRPRSWWSCACGVGKKTPRTNEESFVSLASVLPKMRKPRNTTIRHVWEAKYLKLWVTYYSRQGLVTRNLGYVHQSNLYLPCLLSNISVQSTLVIVRTGASNNKAITNLT